MDKLKKIVVTGAESTGKSVLSKYLADHYNSVFMPEYAREYIASLNRSYTYSDVEYIAKKQVEQEQEYLSKANEFLFYDTFLIITKTWFIWCYNKYPEWIDEYLAKSKFDVFLLCDTDLPWQPDPLRENGGENRKKLMELYKKELEFFNFKYKIISGSGDERFQNAIKIIDKL